MSFKKYCESIYQTKRRATRTVMVGHVAVGSAHPIRLQSMTTTLTRDVTGTVEQIIRLQDAGCEIARVTVQGMKEAESCEQIKDLLIKKGINMPLVADIHFYPPAAMHVADFVDKVRINPGNFIDKRAQFQTIEYTDARYAAELARIEEKFAPLVEKCQKLKRAIRIGTNHGSLSDRIMNRYGDTPLGMVESALEFTRVARKYNFHDLIFSMKSSNPLVMIQAYRLLVAHMMEEGWDYPLHLGVTEAGEGYEGRIKSSMGIGALLLDGLGDTIRISLTEDPWQEIDPGKRLRAFAEQKRDACPEFHEQYRDPFTTNKRKDVSARVVLQASAEEIASEFFYQDIGCKLELGRVKRDLSSCDILVVDPAVESEKLTLLEKAGIEIVRHPHRMTQLTASSQDIPDLIFFAPTNDPLHNSRHFFEWLAGQGLNPTVILEFTFSQNIDDLVIAASAEYGALFCDSLGQGILLHSTILSLKKRRELTLSILQAARLRSSKTEFISCPGCGRTLFDLQKVAAGIREKTSHQRAIPP